jgi:hypothetical protein
MVGQCVGQSGSDNRLTHCGSACVVGIADKLASQVSELHTLNADYKDAEQAWRAVPATWHDTPEKASAVARVDAAAGAVMRAEAAIIRMLLEASA